MSRCYADHFCELAREQNRDFQRESDGIEATMFSEVFDEWLKVEVLKRSQKNFKCWLQKADGWILRKITILCCFMMVAINSSAETRNLGNGRTETINGNSYTWSWKQSFNNGGSVNVTMTGTCSEGKKHGVWKITGTWNKCPLSQSTFCTGTVSVIRTYKNGVLEGAFSMNESLKQMEGGFNSYRGTWVYHAPEDVSERVSGRFVNGRPDGVWTMSDARSGVRYSMTFIEGRPQGKVLGDLGEYWIFDNGLLTFHRYCGKGGSAILEEIRKSFDRASSKSKNHLPDIDIGNTKNPQYYMKGGQWNEILCRGGISTEEPEFEVFEPEDCYIPFDYESQLSDPDYVVSTIKQRKEYNEEMNDKAQLSQYTEEIETYISRNVPRDNVNEFRMYVLKRDVYYAWHAQEYLTKHPEIVEFFKSYISKYPDNEDIKFYIERYFHKINGMSATDFYANICKAAVEEATYFHISLPADELWNLIYTTYRPFIAWDGKLVTYDSKSLQKEQKIGLINQLKYISVKFPLSHNSEEWYQNLVDAHFAWLEKNMEITEDDIRGFVAANFVKDNETNKIYDVSKPKNLNVTAKEVYDFVYEHRKMLPAENALDSYLPYYSAKWYKNWIRDSKRPERLSLRRVSQDLVKNKKFNAIVAQIVEICKDYKKDSF